MSRVSFRAYEKLHEPLASRPVFRQRLLAHLLLVFSIISVTLLIGMAGSIYFGDMVPVDAFLFSSMILAGMGPVGDITQYGMKVFASIFAIFCGVLILVITAFALAPLVHRALHLVHADDKD
jgi:hypothetical protein